VLDLQVTVVRSASVFVVTSTGNRKLGYVSTADSFVCVLK